MSWAPGWPGSVPATPVRSVREFGLPTRGWSGRTGAAGRAPGRDRRRWRAGRATHGRGAGVRVGPVGPWSPPAPWNGPGPSPLGSTAPSGFPPCRLLLCPPASVPSSSPCDVRARTSLPRAAPEDLLLERSSPGPFGDSPQPSPSGSENGRSTFNQGRFPSFSGNGTSPFPSVPPNSGPCSPEDVPAARGRGPKPSSPAAPRRRCFTSTSPSAFSAPPREPRSLSPPPLRETRSGSAGRASSPCLGLEVSKTRSSTRGHTSAAARAVGRSPGPRTAPDAVPDAGSAVRRTVPPGRAALVLPTLRGHRHCRAGAAPTRPRSPHTPTRTRRRPVRAGLRRNVPGPANRGAPATR